MLINCNKRLCGIVDVFMIVRDNKMADDIHCPHKERKSVGKAALGCALRGDLWYLYLSVL